jgi:hypothetical protein
MQQKASVRARFNVVACMYDAINCNLRVKDLSATRCATRKMRIT